MHTVNNSMMPTHEITELLQAWSKGDSQARDKLGRLVDRELKKIAKSYMSREKRGQTLQTTALVHEAFIRLLEGKKISWTSRAHFYAIVARRMRQILIDRAKAKLAAKKGGGAKHIDIDEAVGLPRPIDKAMGLSGPMSQHLIMLDEALTKLSKHDERKAKIVEYRYFGGFTLEEIAKMLRISPATVSREWEDARLWLKREMTGKPINE